MVMKTTLPQGYRIEEIAGGIRQHFPGGYREYQNVRCGAITHCVTDRHVTHRELNQIFNDHSHFHDGTVWNEEFPFQLRSKIDQLEKELTNWKSAAKIAGALATAAIAVIIYRS